MNSVLMGLYCIAFDRFQIKTPILHCTHIPKTRNYVPIGRHTFPNFAASAKAWLNRVSPASSSVETDCTEPDCMPCMQHGVRCRTVRFAVEDTNRLDGNRDGDPCALNNSFDEKKKIIHILFHKGVEGGGEKAKSMYALLTGACAVSSRSNPMPQPA